MKILYLPSYKSQQRQFEKSNVKIYPVLMAMECEWHRKYTDDLCFWGYPASNWDKIITEPEGLPFLSLPHPDRVFTKAKEYISGNYKKLPGTHIMASNFCWYRKCTFCCETTNALPRQVREVDDVIDEINECKLLNFKSVFDDSGTFPVGNWLEEFCKKMEGNKDIELGCNMRLVDIDYMAMKQSGFRMILFGLESANQRTLDRINKGVDIEKGIEVIKKASKAGLEPHICVVFGWEWETDSDALNTLRLVHYLLRKGFAKTAQASFINQQGIKGNESQRHFIGDIYKVAYSPQFWFNQLKDIRDINDIKYLWRKIRAGLNEM